MSQQEFLQPDVEQIRHQIRGILDSYSHDWDLLSEIIQNSIDAIRERGNGKGHVSIYINSSARTIRITDNGIGIDAGDLTRLLRPFGSNKTGKPKQIGEKGVGLKFVMFSSSRMTVISKKVDTGFSVTIKDASAWLRSETDNPLFLSLDAKDEAPTGTTVEFVVDNEDHPIFDFSFEEIQFLLRTKTACGDTGFIWGDPLDADTKLCFIDKSGITHEIEFECRYLLPIEGANLNDSMSIDDFQAWLVEKDRGDAEKRRKLLNKIVFTVGKKWRSGRDIRYWSCFVPKREYWRILSKNVGLIIKDDESLSNDEALGVEFTSGLSTSTKGMPTGISVELKPRGSAGYVPNFFVIIDDPSLRFDIGRKAVQGRQQGMLRDIAYENFRDYIKIRKYMGGSVDMDPLGWDRDEVFEEINSLPDMGSEKTRFVKRPNSQEATVAALFFEQMGKGEFKEVLPLISGYKGRYDLYAKWKSRRVVIEFKFDLAGLFRDFNDERKLFDEVNVVVLWEVTEIDQTLAARRAMTIENIEKSSFSGQQSFPGATRTLSLGDVNPISVIELKSLLAA